MTLLILNVMQSGSRQMQVLLKLLLKIQADKSKSIGQNDGVKTGEVSGDRQTGIGAKQGTG